MEEQLTVTAWHEAGHVWARHRHRLPFRYVTLRPRHRGTAGQIVLHPQPRLIEQGTSSFIAAVGPIAEAMYTHDLRQDPAEGDDQYDFNEHLLGAVLVGGQHDLLAANGMLDEPWYVDQVLRDLRDELPALQRLTDRLLQAHTMTGAEAFSTLGGCWRVPRRAGTDQPSGVRRATR